MPAQERTLDETILSGPLRVWTAQRTRRRVRRAARNPGMGVSMTALRSCEAAPRKGAFNCCGWCVSESNLVWFVSSVMGSEGRKPHVYQLS